MVDEKYIWLLFIDIFTILQFLDLIYKHIYEYSEHILYLDLLVFQQF